MSSTMTSACTVAPVTLVLRTTATGRRTSEALLGDRAEVRRDDDRAVRSHRSDCGRQGRHGRQHLHRDTAHGLQRGGVRVHHDRALGPRSRERVGDDSGTHRLAGPATAVLPRIPEIRQDRLILSATPAAGVQQQEQFHQVVADWGSCRLNHIDVVTSKVIHDRVQLAIREPLRS